VIDARHLGLVTSVTVQAAPPQCSTCGCSVGPSFVLPPMYRMLPLGSATPCKACRATKPSASNRVHVMLSKLSAQTSLKSCPDAGSQPPCKIASLSVTRTRAAPEAINVSLRAGSKSCTHRSEQKGRIRSLLRLGLHSWGGGGFITVRG
jgi:hypothetical protein